MISVFMMLVLNFSPVVYANPQPEDIPDPDTTPESPTKALPSIISELPTFSDKPDGAGVGFGVGEPTGIAAAYRPHEKHTIAGVFGWGFGVGSIHLHADYLATIVRVKPPESILSVDVYAGAGPTINIHHETQPGFGIRVPLGISIAFEKPVDVFMEAAPVIGLIPSTELNINGTVGVRAWFQSSKGNG